MNNFIFSSYIWCHCLMAFGVVFPPLPNPIEYVEIPNGTKVPFYKQFEWKRKKHRRQ